MNERPGISFPLSAPTSAASAAGCGEAPARSQARRLDPKPGGLHKPACDARPSGTRARRPWAPR